MTHELKTWPPYFDEVVRGSKNFELRKQDRPYKTGDLLLLREWDYTKGEYTGREIKRIIMYILTGGQFGLQEGYCILGLLPPLSPSDSEIEKAARERSRIRAMDFLKWYEHSDYRNTPKTVSELYIIFNTLNPEK